MFKVFEASESSRPFSQASFSCPGWKITPKENRQEINRNTILHIYIHLYISLRDILLHNFFYQFYFREMSAPSRFWRWAILIFIYLPLLNATPTTLNYSGPRRVYLFGELHGELANNQSKGKKKK